MLLNRERENLLGKWIEWIALWESFLDAVRGVNPLLSSHQWSAEGFIQKQFLSIIRYTPIFVSSWLICDLKVNPSQVSKYSQVMSRPLSQLLPPPDLPSGGSAQFGPTSTASNGHLGPVASLKSLLQLPIKGDSRGKDCCEMIGESLSVCVCVLMGRDQTTQVQPDLYRGQQISMVEDHGLLFRRL